MTAKFSKVRVNMSTTNRGVVELDGKALAGVRSVTVRAAVDELTTVTIELAASEVSFSSPEAVVIKQEIAT